MHFASRASVAITVRWCPLLSPFSIVMFLPSEEDNIVRFLVIFTFSFNVGFWFQIISGMREISILKVLFTTLVSMPESVCG